MSATIYKGAEITGAAGGMIHESDTPILELKNKRDQMKVIANGGDFMFWPNGYLRRESGTCYESDLPRRENVFDTITTPPDEVASFRKSFDCNKARERRIVAMVGIQEHADAALAALLNDALAYHKCSEDENCDPDMIGVEAMRIAERLAALVNAGDHRPFQRMGAIVRNGGARKGEKGGEYTVEGIVFDKFCHFVCEVKKLPTKKELRELCGLASSKGDEKLFREACNRLGLAGLPTA